MKDILKKENNGDNKWLGPSTVIGGGLLDQSMLLIIIVSSNGLSPVEEADNLGEKKMNQKVTMKKFPRKS